MAPLCGRIIWYIGYGCGAWLQVSVLQPRRGGILLSDIQTICPTNLDFSIYGYLAVDHWCYTLVYESHIERHGAQEKTPLLGKKHYITLLRNDVQAQSEILKKDAVPLMVRWLDAGPEQEVATAPSAAPRLSLIHI